MSNSKEIKKLEQNRFSIVTKNLDFCYLCGQFMDMSRRHICKKNY